jgi:hypothetical protein
VYAPALLIIFLLKNAYISIVVISIFHISGGAKAFISILKIIQVRIAFQDDCGN